MNEIENEMVAQLGSQSLETINAAFENRLNLNSNDLEDLKPLVDKALQLLDEGKIRSAVAISRESGNELQNDWAANVLVNKLILLSFRLYPNEVSESAFRQPRNCDKFPLKFQHWGSEEFSEAAIRVVPGSIVRRGAYIGPNAVLMPSFVNIGAYIGEGTMIDTWATVGSCAQVGKNCHISGGAGIGGVLEPIGERPVIIEDEVFVGARSEVAEGVIVRRGAVLGMGLFLSRSVPIIDRDTGQTFYGEVPENAVVVSGSRVNSALPETSTYAAIIIKYADEKTRGKTALNELVRD